MNAYDLHLLALAGALAGAAIGWQIVFGLAGALSLAAGAAMGLGAYAATILSLQFSWPFELSFLAAGIIPGMLLGAAGLLIARLESHYFALATLALAELALLVATNWESLTGGANGLLGPLPPAWLDAPTSRAAIAWGAALAAAGLFYAFRGWVGRERLALLRAQPLAARTFGIRPARIRAAAMAVAGIAGGLAGAAHSIAVGVVSPDGLAFKTMAAILAIVIIGGRRSPAAAGLMAIAVTWTPELLRFLEQTYLVAYGGFMLAAVLFLPQGLAPQLAAWFGRGPRQRPRPTDPPSASVGPERRAAGAAVEIKALTRRFGGLTAVADVDLAILPGEIVGLIGPNGAGKSTLLNLLSGLDLADAGAIAFADGQRIGRTFQAPALASDLDLFENVRAAAQTEADAWSALAAAGLMDRAGDRVDSLTQAELRFLELARARAVRPGLLLLDEPAAGLAAAERTALAAMLRAAAADGAAVLVVEHDVPFLAAFADRLVCMSDGRVIAAGAPDAVRRADAVIDAYLGRAPA